MTANRKWNWFDHLSRRPELRRYVVTLGIVVSTWVTFIIIDSFFR